MEKTADDIRLIAKYGFLIFADAYTAQIISQKPGQDQQNKNTWDFILEPTDELIKRYELKPNKDPKKGMLFELQLPVDLVVQLNPDPAWNRWLSLRTYDGKVTSAVEFLEGNLQQIIIEKLRRELQKSRIELEAVKEERDLLKNNLPKYLERNAKPFFDIMTPMLEKMNQKKSD